MSVLVADTHATIWFSSADERLSQRAKLAMEKAEQIFVPTISIVEITYLIEKGRIESAALPALLAMLADPSSPFTSIQLTLGMALGKIPRHLVPDLPDRVIAVTGYAMGLPVLTADQWIRASGVETIW